MLQAEGINQYTIHADARFRGRPCPYISPSLGVSFSLELGPILISPSEKVRYRANRTWKSTRACNPSHKPHQSSFRRSALTELILEEILGLGAFK
jgi:hypothetical protein